MPTFDAPPGTVVVLPFPYADRLAERRRPALVISMPDIAARHHILWVAMITSAANAGWEKDVAIANPERSGLGAPSVIRPAKLATIDASRVLHTLGTVSQNEFAAVRAAIIATLG